LGEEASLALNRDHSMRALHRRSKTDDGDTPNSQEEEEEEVVEEETDHDEGEGVGEEVEDLGDSACSKKTGNRSGDMACPEGDFRLKKSTSSSKQRPPHGRGMGRMVVCCIRNLCAHLRSPDHVLTLLRFLVAHVLPKIALNIAR
jgi:hypothetical protein